MSQPYETSGPLNQRQITTPDLLQEKKRQIDEQTQDKKEPETKPEDQRKVQPR